MQPTTTDKKDKTQRQKSKDNSLSSVVRSVKNEMSLKEKSFVTYNDDGIKIVLYFMESEQRNMCRILAVFTNNNIFEVDQFSFKVSVPNYIKLQMKPANDTKLLPLSQNSIEQKLQVINTMYGQKPFRIGIKISYQRNGEQKTFTEQVQIPHVGDFKVKCKEWEFDNSIRRNLRTLIAKLSDVLPSNLNWKSIPMNQLLKDDQLKKAYYKAIRVVHPDKSMARADCAQNQAICNYVFKALETAFHAQFG